jgi:hypothetical protein
MLSCAHFDSDTNSLQSGHVRPVPTLFLLTLCAIAGRAQAPSAQPLTLDFEGLKLRPGAFLDLIGLTRTATTPDTINTHFGAIPLVETPSESLWSPRHSRLWLRGDRATGPVTLTFYLESDFLNPNAGQSPYRWRQYWGAVHWRKWEISGGREWNLLRPNRFGVQSDTGTMNTLVPEPAYHVGLDGTRDRQFRLTRNFGDYNAVFAWQTNGLFLARVAVDKKFGHIELDSILAGHHGQHGISAAAYLNVSKRVRVETQEYWSKRAAYQALGVVPTNVDGGNALEGLEFFLTPRIDAYAYAGWAYAARSGGNRVVREYTVGGDYRIPIPSLHGLALFSLQLSRMDRALWIGQSGVMSYAMYRFRYTFN